MQVYSSPFQTIHYLAEKGILQKEWYDTTEQMSVGDFKVEVLKIAEMAAQYKPAFFHDNTQAFAFPIDPDLQSWVDQEIFPQFIQAGLRKYAIIVSKEMVAQLSIEQTMEESQAAHFQVRYFDNGEEAMQWLLA